MQDDLAWFAADLQVRQNKRSRAVVVPLLFRHLLVVPGIAPGMSVDRNDRAQEEIVAAAGTAEGLRVRGAVAGAEVDEVELRVVDDGIPVVASSSDFPPF